MKKCFFSENASIHERARVPLILTFLLALIAGFFENIAKFSLAPYLACVNTLIPAIFPLKRSKNKSLTIEMQYCYCCLRSGSCMREKVLHLSTILFILLKKEKPNRWKVDCIRRHRFLSTVHFIY
jgi:hypothetical protein